MKDGENVDMDTENEFDELRRKREQVMMMKGEIYGKN